MHEQKLRNLALVASSTSSSAGPSWRKRACYTKSCKCQSLRPIWSKTGYFQGGVRQLRYARILVATLNALVLLTSQVGMNASGGFTKRAQLCSSLSHCENTFGAVETIHPLLRKKKRGTSQLGRSWISRKKKQFSSCQYINDTDPSIRVEIVSWSSWLNLCGETIVVMIVHSGFLFILQKSTINALRKPYQQPGVFLCAVITSFAKNYTSDFRTFFDTRYTTEAQKHAAVLPSFLGV